MSRLDEELRKITVPVWHAGQGTFDYPLNDEGVEKVKQAFKDAGWFSLSESATGGRLISTVKQYEGLMTGQEWYDRFSKEMSDRFSMWGDGSNGFVELKPTKEAAKKAAGIEKE